MQDSCGVSPGREGKNAAQLAAWAGGHEADELWQSAGRCTVQVARSSMHPSACTKDKPETHAHQWLPSTSLPVPAILPSCQSCHAPCTLPSCAALPMLWACTASHCPCCLPAHTRSCCLAHSYAPSVPTPAHTCPLSRHTCCTSHHGLPRLAFPKQHVLGLIDLHNRKRSSRIRCHVWVTADSWGHGCRAQPAACLCNTSQVPWLRCRRSPLNQGGSPP